MRYAATRRRYFYNCAHLIVAWFSGLADRVGFRADHFAPLERSHTTQSKQSIVSVTHTIVTTRYANRSDRYLFISDARSQKRTR